MTERASVLRLGPSITATDVDSFAGGIVERWESASDAEKTDEARMLAALAEDYLAYRKAAHGA